MNRPRRVGTDGENYFLGVLRRLFGPDVERLDNVARHRRAEDADFVGVPWPHEAKNTPTSPPKWKEWIRTLRAKAGEDWTLLWKGDMRRPDGKPIAMMPLARYEALVRGDHLPVAQRVQAAHLKTTAEIVELHDVRGTP